MEDDLCDDGDGALPRQYEFRFHSSQVLSRVVENISGTLIRRDIESIETTIFVCCCLLCLFCFFLPGLPRAADKVAYKQSRAVQAEHWTGSFHLPAKHKQTACRPFNPLRLPYYSLPGSTLYSDNMQQY